LTEPPIDGHPTFGSALFRNYDDASLHRLGVILLQYAITLCGVSVVCIGMMKVFGFSVLIPLISLFALLLLIWLSSMALSESDRRSFDKIVDLMIEGDYQGETKEDFEEWLRGDLE
jgi:hypothetical protein